MSQLNFDSIKEGDSAEFEVQISEKDIDSFAVLSGDISPLHMNTDFCIQRGFKGRLVHGLYLGALVSRLVGMHVPGKNSIDQQIQLSFHSPTYAQDRIKIIGKVLVKSEPVRSLKIGVSILRTSDNKELVSGKILVGFTNI